jgi:hypothetical protein
MNQAPYPDNDFCWQIFATGAAGQFFLLADFFVSDR